MRRAATSSVLFAIRTLIVESSTGRASDPRDGGDIQWRRGIYRTGGDGSRYRLLVVADESRIAYTRSDETPVAEMNRNLR
jgi:hypothetical protein